MTSITHSGFIGLLGRPNVGKSTLLNRFLGEKIAITSPKPQTTRNRIAGVLNRGHTQLIFFDTPGVHEGEKLINRYMVREALACLPDLNAAVFLADATSGPTEDDRSLARRLAGAAVPVILALNKIDIGSAPTEAYSDLLPFHSAFRISAAKGEGVEELLEALAALLPEGPEYYPEDVLTDRTERFIAAEFIREKTFQLTGEEVPYSIAVTIDSWKENPETGVVVVYATIHVERDSQKGILIGKGGRLIKAIGMRARHDLEGLLQSRVYLDLHVAVDRNWTRDPAALRRFGYEVKS
ncbi:MAG: GTPase Era [Deltaproteobacteria bacterium]|nr:GTPase Era [Deltaproteobacteria bacterium]